MIVCPGCGARNDPAARACDWCARPFVAERTRVSVPWLAPVAGGVIAMVAVGIVIAANVGARSSSGREAPPAAHVLEAPVSAAAPTDVPDATSVAAQPAPADAEEFVRIANTGGTGAFVRREPRSDAQGVVAYRDGTLLRVVGPNVTTDGRVWREVQDARGNRGWTPREFLASTESSF